MTPRNKHLLDGIILLALGAILVIYSIYDSLDGSFIAGSKYGISNRLSITDGSGDYWFAVGFRVFLGIVGIALGIYSIKDFKNLKNPYD